MSVTPEIDKRSVDAQAASWFSHNQNAPSRAARKAFEQWLETPEHARAYSQFEQLWADLAALKALNKPAPLPQRQAKVWRPALAAAAALVCTLLASNLGVPNTVFEQHLASTHQALHSVRLPDGSELNMNANTRLRIDFSAERRLIHLDQGQLYIDVAADKERPLFVDAGTARVRVVGTGFDLRRGQRELVLSVAHGTVALETPGEGRAPALLNARQRVTYDLARGSLSWQTVSAQEVADWRSGHVSFRNRELASLVDELSIYRPNAVLLADSSLAGYKVSGNLDVHDPDALLNALPALLPVKSVPLADGRLRIERRSQ
ncbi:iron dicitrate transport regulator FecR [Pseudomonas sp. SDI]|uniref:FecR family protein n=1 Tax=Pseudomonas sp. SDI TaxID=2170734 RepID=UPI000DE6207D|nr:FecR domain-containing protein [Pseudomonas sp. SDI]PWB33327.1 iron dicitrate transport regulator FecR [Pseudomonas sp. SDI]